MLEVVVCSIVDFLFVLKMRDGAWEEIVHFDHNFFDLVMSFIKNFGVRLVCEVAEMLHCDYKFLFVEMRSFQHLVLKVFKLLLGNLSGHSLTWSNKAALNMLIDRCKYVFLNVLEKCLNKGGANGLNPTQDPMIIVKEVSLASKNTEVNSEVIIFTIDDGH